MTAIQEIEKRKNPFTRQEIAAASSILFDTFSVDEKDAARNEFYEKQIAYIEEFAGYLNKILRSDKVKTNEERVTLMKVIAKLVEQKETLEILSGKVSLKDLQTAADRFAKKAQSSVAMPKVLEK
ncbi:MAG: hypothetical protein AAB316_25290 [Bacteroidota bacterium]